MKKEPELSLHFIFFSKQSSSICIMSLDDENENMCERVYFRCISFYRAFAYVHCMMVSLVKLCANKIRKKCEAKQNRREAATMRWVWRHKTAALQNCLPFAIIKFVIFFPFAHRIFSLPFEYTKRTFIFRRHCRHRHSQQSNHFCIIKCDISKAVYTVHVLNAIFYWNNKNSLSFQQNSNLLLYCLCAICNNIFCSVFISSTIVLCCSFEPLRALSRMTMHYIMTRIVCVCFRKLRMCGTAEKLEITREYELYRYFLTQCLHNFDFSFSSFFAAFCLLSVFLLASFQYNGTFAFKRKYFFLSVSFSQPVAYSFSLFRSLIRCTYRFDRKRRH